MTADIRTAAEAEAAENVNFPLYHPSQRMPVDLTPFARSQFIEGAVWAAERATPTREQIIETLHDQGAYCGVCDYESLDCVWCDRVLKKYADAVLALMSH